jgi:hypothetical protein
MNARIEYIYHLRGYSTILFYILDNIRPASYFCACACCSNTDIEPFIAGLMMALEFPEQSSELVYKLDHDYLRSDG